MNKAVFLEQFNKLLTEYPGGKDGITEDRIDQWWEDLQYIPAKYFVSGIAKVIRTREYPTFPTLGEVLKASIGDHHHMIPVRRRTSGEPSVDDILIGYKEKYEERRRKLPAPDGSNVPAVYNPNAIVASQHRELESQDIKIAGLERENVALHGNISRLREELADMRRFYQKLHQQYRQVSEACAGAERAWRESHGIKPSVPLFGVNNHGQ